MIAFDLPATRCLGANLVIGIKPKRCRARRSIPGIGKAAKSLDHATSKNGNLQL